MIDAKIKKKHHPFRSRLVKNSLYTGLALAFVGIVPFIFNSIIARTFGEEILGSINIVLSFSLIITTFITNFLGTSANKFLAEYRGRKSLNHFIFTFQIMIYGSLVILSIVSLTLITKWDFLFPKFSISPESLYPIIAFIFLRSFYILFRRAFYGMDMIQPYAINEIICDVFMIIGISYICYIKQSVFLIHSYLISYLIFFILSIFTLINKFDQITSTLDNIVNFSKTDVLKKFFKYGFISMIGTVASTGTGYLSIIFTGIFLSNADVGLYSSVITIVSVLTFIPKLFSNVFLPEFSKLFGEGNKQKIIEIIKQSFWIMLLTSIIICTVLFLFAGNILSIFGESFIKASLILKIIIPSVFIRMISIPFVSFLSGTKYIIHPNVGGILILFISLSVWLLLVPDLKLIGIAIGYTSGIFFGISYQILIAILKIRIF